MSNKTIYVIMNRERSSVLNEPASGKPFRTELKKYAEQIATEAGGVVEELKDAILYVRKHPANRGQLNNLPFET